jgi:hypothetical protein
MRSRRPTRASTWWFRPVGIRRAVGQPGEGEGHGPHTRSPPRGRPVAGESRQLNGNDRSPVAGGSRQLHENDGSPVVRRATAEHARAASEPCTRTSTQQAASSQYPSRWTSLSSRRRSSKRTRQAQGASEPGQSRHGRLNGSRVPATGEPTTAFRLGARRPSGGAMRSPPPAMSAPRPSVSATCGGAPWKNARSVSDSC